jgi:hypothetical protein
MSRDCFSYDPRDTRDTSPRFPAISVPEEAERRWTAPGISTPVPLPVSDPTGKLCTDGRVLGRILVSESLNRIIRDETQNHGG